MIRKLLVVFSIVLGTVGVAWGQTTTEIKTVEELRAALANAKSGDVISLAADTFKFTSQLSIDKSITLQGAGEGTVLAATGTWTSSNPEKNLVSILSDNVTLKNLKVSGSKRNGVNVYTSTGVLLENVWIEKSNNAGLMVNGSKVEANGLQTAENSAGQLGVEVAVGKDVTSDTEFKFDAACTFAEQAQITSAVKSGINISVVTPAGTLWGFGKSGSIIAYTNRVKMVDGKLLAVVNTTKELTLALSAHKLVTETNLKGIYLEAGTYALASPLSIDRSITIAGPTEAGKVANIQTAGDASAFLITSTSDKDIISFENNLVIKRIKGEATDPGQFSSAIDNSNHKTGNTKKDDFKGILSLKGITIDGYYHGLILEVKKSTEKLTVPATLLVDNCVFKNCMIKALYTELSNTTITRSTFENCATMTHDANSYVKIAVDINLKYADYTSLSVEECTFNKNGSVIEIIPPNDYPNKIAYSAALGVKARNDGSYTSLSASLENVVIKNNTFTDNHQAIQFGEPKSRGSNVLKGITMENNTFSGNNNDIVNISSNTQIASLVRNEKGLLDVMADVAPGATIQLAADVTLPKETGTNGMGLAINTKITLDGNGYTLKPGEGFAGYMLTVGQDGQNPTGVAVRNLVLDNAKKAKGLNVFGTTDVTLSNVTSINSAGAGVVVNNSTVSATDLNTSGNAWGGVNVDKGTPKFTFVSGSLNDASPIYSEVADTTGIVVVPAGWEATQTTKDNKTVTVWKKSRIIPTLTAPVPTVGTAEAGKTLAAYILTGGKATVEGTPIAGVFAWANPDTIVTATTKSYAVLFTPVDPATYASATTSATFGEIKEYVTITTGKCANGKVVIAKANPDNRYEKGKSITVTAVPENGNYAFAAWGEDIEVGEDGSYTPVADKELTATFTEIKHTVTVAVTGSGSVYINGVQKADKATVEVSKGSSLLVTTAPTDANVLDTLYCSDGKKISSGAVVVDKDFTITARFKALPVEKKMFAVNVASNLTNGKILLFDNKGVAVTPGKAVDENAVLSVIAVPDMGYAIDVALSATGSTLKDGKCTITAATTFSCTFKPISYAITIADLVGGTIEVKKKTADKQATDESTEAENTYPFGTELTATAAASEGYRLLSLVVNGKEIPNGGTFKVAAATTIQATMRKLATVAIDEAVQTFVYDGTAKKFVVKTTPAGLGGFDVTYNETPLNAASHTRKAYDVTIVRSADDTYAAVNKTIAGGLVVLAADPEGVAIPTASEGVIQNNTLGLYAWEGEVGDQPIATAIYTPTNASLKKVKFSIATGKGTPTPVTYEWGKLARKAATKADDPTLTVAPGITLWNGATQLTSGNLYVGQQINLKATIPAGHSEEVAWTINGAASTSATASITLTAGRNTVSAVSIQKTPAPFPGMQNLTATYDGTVFGDAASAPSVKAGGVADNWQIAFQQAAGQVVSEPTEAGSYTIVVSRPADAKYAETQAVAIGDQFVISPKAATVSGTLAATPVLQGQTLAQSVISGAADVDGLFSWANPDQVADGKESTVVFTPTNANYKAPAEALQATAAVTQTDIPLHTLSLTVANPEKGTPVGITLNGTPAASGAMVEPGDKLIVTFGATAAHYTASATINGVSYASGAVYEVKVAGKVDVRVAYTYQGGGSTDVTGVSLNVSTAALAVGAELTLVATVEPENATNKGVTWASSRPAIATVDAYGKVKALAAGTCQIVVTTDDGSYTATCDVTVSEPTGIDELLAGSRVYAQDGAICIDPAQPLKATVVNIMGAAIYSGQVTGFYRIPASSGAYVVKLGDGRKDVFVKVFVR